MMNLTTIISAIITGIIGWIVAGRNNNTNRENLYAEHTKDMWERLDKVSSQLDSVTQERDELKIQVSKLEMQVNNQSKLINELRQSIKNLTEEVSKNE